MPWAIRRTEVFRVLGVLGVLKVLKVLGVLRVLEVLEVLGHPGPILCSPGALVDVAGEGLDVVEGG